QQLRQVLTGDPDLQYRAYQLALLGTLERDLPMALEGIDRMVAHNRDPEAWFYMVRSLAKLGEREQALDLLERAARSFFPVYACEHDPCLDSLRESPRFASIVAPARERQEAARAVWAS